MQQRSILTFTGKITSKSHDTEYKAISIPVCDIQYMLLGDNYEMSIFTFNGDEFILSNITKYTYDEFIAIWAEGLSKDAK